MVENEKKHTDLTRYSDETLELYKAKLQSSIRNKRREIRRIVALLKERESLKPSDNSD